MMSRNLEDIDRWHVLFDEMWPRAGFHDVASLASRYCELTGGSGQKELDAALRNLNNWRSGRHIPRLRSLRILEQALDIGRDPILLARWNALYKEATQNVGNAPAAPADPVRMVPGGLRPGRAVLPRWAKAAAGGALLFGIGVVVGNVWASGWRPWGGPADDAPMVVYKSQVTMAVGDSKVIHAERGDCGKLPRDWVDVVSNLPASALGSFSDGGHARRYSKFCKGPTPARAIIFTARRAGVEEFRIDGDFLKVTVTETDLAEELPNPG